MNETAQKYMNAMKAGMIPAGWSGLWSVSKLTLLRPTPTMRAERAVIAPPGEYTFLKCLTDASLYAALDGECVMEDSEDELKTHFDFVMNARGKVLVTGLGLGCVTRGLLINPLVEHVTVIEKSSDVLTLVRPSMLALNNPKLEIIQADALEWTKQNTEVFDYGWHDLWTNRSGGEPHLDEWHMELLLNCRYTVKNQGAWAFDERLKALLVKGGFPWVG